MSSKYNSTPSNQQFDSFQSMGASKDYVKEILERDMEKLKDYCIDDVNNELNRSKQDMDRLDDYIDDSLRKEFITFFEELQDISQKHMDALGKLNPNTMLSEKYVSDVYSGKKPLPNSQDVAKQAKTYNKYSKILEKYEKFKKKHPNIFKGYVYIPPGHSYTSAYYD